MGRGSSSMVAEQVGNSSRVAGILPSPADPNMRVSGPKGVDSWIRQLQMEFASKARADGERFGRLENACEESIQQLAALGNHRDHCFYQSDT